METTTGKMERQIPPVIRTYTGKNVNIAKPDYTQFDKLDIAHSLAHQCRFAGHTPKHYSIAQHAVLCATLAKERGYNPLEVLEVLTHDNPEAYLVDIPSPLKQFLSQYKTIEDIMGAVMAKWQGTSYPLSEKTHAIDKEMTWMEFDMFFEKNETARLLSTFDFWTADEAKYRFLEFWNQTVIDILRYKKSL